MPENAYELADFVGEAITFLEQVVGRPSILVGHSHGGSVAARCAIDRPDLVSGLALIEPSLVKSRGTRFRANSTNSAADHYGTDAG